MSSERPPPPYQPLYPEAPAFPPVLSSHHASVPGSPFQTVLGGGDRFYHCGPPTAAGPPGTFYVGPGYQGYQAGPHTDSPKQRAYVPQQQEPRGGADGSCPTGLLPALCCCCLWNALFRGFC